MSDSRLSASFSNWSDRLTYIVAEAQLLTAAVVVACGLAFWYFGVSLPGIPQWVSDLVIGWLVLGPIMFIAGLRFVGWLRVRNYVEVHHVNVVEDVVKGYYVPPEVWAEKRVDGPAPYRMNDGDAIVVREFEWTPEYESLVVSGVYLSEMEDTKLLTSQSHMERMYESLVDSHLSLAYLRDSISELSADLQTRLINRMAVARERGEMLDKTAVKDVVEEFREQAESVTDDDLGDIQPEDYPAYAPDELPYEALPGPDAPSASDGHGQTAAATDGGSTE